ISHLMDVLSDAQEILSELGVHFESSASEATAAATLAASVHYPIRGAVTFKSPVGINVASDALANLASGGVKGGALIILGEDYGEGCSIMQERSHAFVMQVGMYNGVMRALQRLGLADIRGNTDVPLYVLNVTYPLIDEEFLDFARGKGAVLVVEEGQPNHIEQAFGAMLHKAGMPTKLL